MEDREGNVWVGTRHDGLIQMQPRRVVSFTVRDGLISDVVRSVCEGPDRSIWVGTDYLNYIKDGTVHSVDFWSARDPGSDRAVSSLMVDHAGSVWMGKESGNLYLVKDGANARFPGIGVPQNETIFALYEDQDQSVWVGYQGGVILIKSSDFVQFDKAQYFLNHLCGSILQDKTGRVWLGTFKGGVFRYENGKFDHLTVSNGLSSDDILSLYEDTLDTI